MNDLESYTTYEAVREALLDGRIDVQTGEALVARLKPTAEELLDWQTLCALEHGLHDLARPAAHDPWLALKVENQLQVRQRAGRWLAEHPRGLLGLSGLGTSQAEICRWLTHAAAAAGGAGFAVLTCGLALDGVQVSGLGVDPLLLAAAVGGVLGLAALRWPELRGYFTS